MGTYDGSSGGGSGLSAVYSETGAGSLRADGTIVTEGNGSAGSIGVSFPVGTIIPHVTDIKT